MLCDSRFLAGEGFGTEFSVEGCIDAGNDAAKETDVMPSLKGFFWMFGVIHSRNLENRSFA
jgi:hypothetical protein